MKIVILGGTGRIGSNLLKSALNKGHEVLAIARHPENIKVKHDNLQIKNVNIFDENVMAEELQGKDALVSCLGASGSLFSRQEVTLYTDTAKIFANAMRRSGMNRLVVMSAWYIAGDTPFWVKCASIAWAKVIRNMRAMEVYLEENCSDLDFTAVKLAFGKGQNETGKTILTNEGHSVPGAGMFITYGDLSKFIIENCLVNGDWKKKLVSVAT